METPKEGRVKRKWSILVHYGPQYNNCVQSWAVHANSVPYQTLLRFQRHLSYLSRPLLFFCFMAFLSAGNWCLFMPRFEVRPNTFLCGAQRETQNDSSHMQRDFLSCDGWT